MFLFSYVLVWFIQVKYGPPKRVNVAKHGAYRSYTVVSFCVDNSCKIESFKYVSFPVPCEFFSIFFFQLHNFFQHKQ